MWEDLEFDAAFFPSSGTLIQKTLREERLCLPVVSMLILVPFSVYSQFEMWNLPVFTSHSFIVLKPNLIKCWFLPAKFIDLSVCTGHLMLGFFEPTYRHRMAQGRCWTGPTGEMLIFVYPHLPHLSTPASWVTWVTWVWRAKLSRRYPNCTATSLRSCKCHSVPWPHDLPMVADSQWHLRHFRCVRQDFISNHFWLMTASALLDDWMKIGSFYTAQL